jgi:hypothetical protein
MNITYLSGSKKATTNVTRADVDEIRKLHRGTDEGCESLYDLAQRFKLPVNAVYVILSRGQ